MITLRPEQFENELKGSSYGRLLNMRVELMAVPVKEQGTHWKALVNQLEDEIASRIFKVVGVSEGAIVREYGRFATEAECVSYAAKEGIPVGSEHAGAGSNVVIEIAPA